jgi:transposase
MYQLKNGCQWRDLPQDLPNWQTVYSQFRRWQNQGTWEKVLTALEKVEREKSKTRENPSLLIGDSMCAQNTDAAGIESKGFCHKGRESCEAMVCGYSQEMDSGENECMDKSM